MIDERNAAICERANGRAGRNSPGFPSPSGRNWCSPHHHDYDRFSLVFRASYDCYDPWPLERFHAAGTMSSDVMIHHGRCRCGRPLNARTEEFISGAPLDKSAAPCTRFGNSCQR